MTHYFFDSGIFLANAWASNTLSAEGVPVPNPPIIVPQPVRAATGGSYWKYKKVQEEECEDFIDQVVKKYCPEPGKTRRAYPYHLENLGKIKPPKDREDQKKVKLLQGRITKLEERIRELKADVENKNRALTRRVDDAHKIQRLAQKARKLVRRLEKILDEVEKREAELERREAALKAKEEALKAQEAALSAQATAQASQTLQAVSGPPRAILGLRAALPWALGSTVVGLATHYLVPEDRKTIRFVGFTATSVLAFVAVRKGLTAAFTPDGA